MYAHYGDPLGARFGIAFGVWFLALLYVLINGIWLGVAAAVVAGIALVFFARAASRSAAGIR